MWKYDDNWMVYRLDFDDFWLGISNKLRDTDTYLISVTSYDLKKIYIEDGFTNLELAKERALVLYSKVSGKSMNGIRAELYKRETA